jgi:hypothetical protein
MRGRAAATASTLADAGFTAEQHETRPERSAAEHAIELVDARRHPLGRDRRHIGV